MVDSSLSMYVRGQGTDPSGMGRWSWIRLQRLGLPDLIIVTAYRVCISSNVHAKQTAHLQQSRALTQQDCPVLDPREAFLLDLGRFLRGHQQQEHSLMVLIDANDEFKPGTDWHTFAMEHDLVDCFQHRHPSISVRTYHRGKRQIDFILVSSSLIQL